MINQTPVDRERSWLKVRERTKNYINIIMGSKGDYNKLLKGEANSLVLLSLLEDGFNPNSIPDNLLFIICRNKYVDAAVSLRTTLKNSFYRETNRVLEKGQDDSEERTFQLENTIDFLPQEKALRLQKEQEIKFDYINTVIEEADVFERDRDQVRYIYQNFYVLDKEATIVAKELEVSRAQIYKTAERIVKAVRCQRVKKVLEIREEQEKVIEAVLKLPVLQKHLRIYNGIYIHHLKDRKTIKETANILKIGVTTLNNRKSELVETIDNNKELIKQAKEQRELMSKKLKYKKDHLKVFELLFVKMMTIEEATMFTNIPFNRILTIRQELSQIVKEEEVFEQYREQMKIRL